MSTITLRQALVSWPSHPPFSVKTVTARVRDTFDDLKEYLYVEQDIELDFKRLTSLRPGEIIFLCGSSGDGKSEILTRSYASFRSKFKFHLDANQCPVAERATQSQLVTGLACHLPAATLLRSAHQQRSPRNVQRPKKIRAIYSEK